MKLRMSLDYTISNGDLSPYFEALKQGNALGSACETCRQIAFPARIICNGCGSQKMYWKTLSGVAQVIHRTDGPQSGFALVQFSGADTRTTVALVNPVSNATTGKLSRPMGENPGVWLQLNDS